MATRHWGLVGVIVWIAAGQAATIWQPEGAVEAVVVVLFSSLTLALVGYGLAIVWEESSGVRRPQM